MNVKKEYQVDTNFASLSITVTAFNKSEAIREANAIFSKAEARRAMLTPSWRKDERQIHFRIQR